MTKYSAQVNFDLVFFMQRDWNWSSAHGNLCELEFYV